MKKSGRITKAVANALSKRDRATIYSVEGRRVNARVGNSPTLLRNVEIVGGDPSTLAPGQELPILWKKNRPILVMGSVLDGNSNAVMYEAGGNAELNVQGLGGVLAEKQDAGYIQGTPIDATAPEEGQVLMYQNGAYIASTTASAAAAFSDAEGYPVDTAAAAAYGSSTYPARRDHAHKTVLTADGTDNTKLANMAVNTIKGRITAGTGDPEDLTLAQVLTMLKTVDGASSGLDADLLDGLEASAFALASHTHAGSQITSSVPLADAVNGVSSAGVSKYYGTDGAGLPGFFGLPAGGGGGGSDSGNGFYSLHNNSGVTVNLGDVVIVDASIERGFKLSTIAGDRSVIGVVIDATIAAGAWGNIAYTGLVQVNVSGNVAVGDYLISSATSHYAKDAATIQRPDYNNIGLAMSAYSGGATGQVYAMIDVKPSQSKSGLSQLATQTFSSSGGNGGPQTFAHTVDAGTDLLLVAIVCYRGASTSTPIPTSVTWNGITMGLTSFYHGYSSTSYGVTLAYLRNPDQGNHNIVINSTAQIKAQALNLNGSMATPLRTPQSDYLSSSTSISETVTSNLGDLVIDILCYNPSAGTWSAGAGQTIQVLYTSNIPAIGVSIKNGAVSSTTTGWTGASSPGGAYLSVAIAGS